MVFIDWSRWREVVGRTLPPSVRAMGVGTASPMSHLSLLPLPLPPPLLLLPGSAASSLGCFLLVLPVSSPCCFPSGNASECPLSTGHCAGPWKPRGRRQGLFSGRCLSGGDTGLKEAATGRVDSARGVGSDVCVCPPEPSGRLRLRCLVPDHSTDDFIMSQPLLTLSCFLPEGRSKVPSVSAPSVCARRGRDEAGSRR